MCSKPQDHIFTKLLHFLMFKSILEIFISQYAVQRGVKATFRLKKNNNYTVYSVAPCLNFKKGLTSRNKKRRAERMKDSRQYVTQFPTKKIGVVHEW